MAGNFVEGYGSSVIKLDDHRPSTTSAKRAAQLERKRARTPPPANSGNTHRNSGKKKRV
jgi:hypothetical protein